MTIYHVCEQHHDSVASEVRRKDAARTSWQLLYSQGVKPLYLKACQRTSAEVGDRRNLPFLKDVLSLGVDAAQQANDIVMFTNDDVFLHPALPAMLKGHLDKHACCSSQRCEFVNSQIPNGMKPEEYAQLGQKHMGRDLSRSPLHG